MARPRRSRRAIVGGVDVATATSDPSQTVAELLLGAAEHLTQAEDELLRARELDTRADGPMRFFQLSQAAGELRRAILTDIEIT